MEWYSALKKKEILSYATTSLNFEDSIVSEISQSAKDKYCMIHLHVVSEVLKPLETERRLVVARD